MNAENGRTYTIITKESLTIHEGLLERLGISWTIRPKETKPGGGTRVYGRTQTKDDRTHDF